MLKYKCDNCSHEFASELERKVQCPRCQWSSSVRRLEAEGVKEIPAKNCPVPVSEQGIIHEEKRKKCPFCAEEIQKEAIVCRFCRFDLKTGKPVEVTAPVAPAEKSAPSSRKGETKNSFGDGIKFGCGLFLVLPLIVVGAFLAFLFFGSTLGALFSRLFVF